MGFRNINILDILKLRITRSELLIIKHIKFKFENRR